jgi:hypothetical protein
MHVFDVIQKHHLAVLGAEKHERTCPLVWYGDQNMMVDICFFASFCVC